MFAFAFDYYYYPFVSLFVEFIPRIRPFVMLLMDSDFFMLRMELMIKFEGLEISMERSSASVCYDNNFQEFGMTLRTAFIISILKNANADSRILFLRFDYFFIRRSVSRKIPFRWNTLNCFVLKPLL